MYRNCFVKFNKQIYVVQNVCANPLFIYKFKHKTVPQNRNYSVKSFDNFAVSYSKFFENISQSVPVEFVTHTLKEFHNTIPLPWWLSIILSTVLLRSTVTLPAAIYQQKILARLENIQPEMRQLVKELKEEVKIARKLYKWDEKKTKFMYNKSVKKLWNNLIIRDNCHAFKTTIVLCTQIPLWILLSLSYRKLARPSIDDPITFLYLSVGGFGWIPNLTDVDHFLILPISVAVINYLIIDTIASNVVLKPTFRTKLVDAILKTLTLAMIPIAAKVPGCVVLYWTTSSICAFAQNLFLMHPKVRRALQIPKTEKESQNPYSDIFINLKKKYPYKLLSKS